MSTDSVGVPHDKLREVLTTLDRCSITDNEIDHIDDRESTGSEGGSGYKIADILVR